MKIPSDFFDDFLLFTNFDDWKIHLIAHIKKKKTTFHQNKI